MINVTPSAASKISELLSEENKVEAGLRVFVQGGGCSGFQYGLMIDEGEGDASTDAVIESNVRDETAGILKTLSPKEEKVIRMRFGIGCEREHTLEEIGQEFDVTRERIRQLQNIALSKLRRALSKKEKPIDVELPVEA